jgi:hypothetical protein
VGADHFTNCCFLQHVVRAASVLRPRTVQQDYPAGSLFRGHLLMSNCSSTIHGGRVWHSSRTTCAGKEVVCVAARAAMATGKQCADETGVTTARNLSLQVVST